METEKTTQILKHWLNSFANDDMEAVIDGLAETVVFHAPLNEFNKVIPYLGRKVGRQAVVEAFELRAQVVSTLEYELLDMIVQQNRACIVSHTKEICQRTQTVFELEDVQLIVLDQDGKIAEWRFYFDPNAEVSAFKADLEVQLIEAVQHNQLDRIRFLIDVGANVNVRDPKTGLTVLMLAARQANSSMVETLLDAGAEVWMLDSHLGTSVLHQACRGGSAEVVQILVAAGAFVDAVTATSGHSTPLHEALRYGHTDCAEILILSGADLGWKGDDSQTGFAIALETLGRDHPLVQRLYCQPDLHMKGR